METVSASVNILGRTYKLRVAAEDEEALRKAAEAISVQAKSYGQMYAYNDHQDLLAMVALTQITQLTKIQDSLRFKDTDLAQRLNTIDSIMEQLDPSHFFRANRQYIVAHHAISEIALWPISKLALTLCVPTPDRIIISKARVSEFKQWYTK